MPVSFSERPTNTDEQVEEYLRKARDLVNSIGFADDLRVVAFDKAVSLFAAKNLIPDDPLVPTGLTLLGKH